MQVIQPIESLPIAESAFISKGFFRVRRSKESIYLKRRDSNYLVRVTTHPTKNPNLSKVHFELLLDYPTIKSDIVFRCTKMIDDYCRKLSS